MFRATKGELRAVNAISHRRPTSSDRTLHLSSRTRARRSSKRKNKGASCPSGPAASLRIISDGLPDAEKCGRARRTRSITTPSARTRSEQRGRRERALRTFDATAETVGIRQHPVPPASRCASRRRCRSTAIWSNATSKSPQRRPARSKGPQSEGKPGCQGSAGLSSPVERAGQAWVRAHHRVNAGSGAPRPSAASSDNSPHRRRGLLLCVPAAG